MSSRRRIHIDLPVSETKIVGWRMSRPRGKTFSRVAPGAAVLMRGVPLRA
jgi:hypothetical protein